MLDYLSFLLHLEVTDEFDYTPAEKYVADKLANADVEVGFDWFPMRQAMTLQRKGNKNAMLSTFGDISTKLDTLEAAITERDKKLDGRMQLIVRKALEDARVVPPQAVSADLPPPAPPAPSSEGDGFGRGSPFAASDPEPNSDEE